VDAGTADAGIVTDIFEILAERKDDRIGEPDIPDTVLPEVPVHQLGDRLADPAEGDLATAKDVEDVGNPAVACLPFRPPELGERCKDRRHRHDHWDLDFFMISLIHVSGKIQVFLEVQRLARLVYLDPPPGFGSPG